MAKQEIYQHFKLEEQELIEKTYDLIKQAEDTYSFCVTDFLNPRQIMVMKSIIGQTSLKCYVSSDLIPSEYARLLIAPAYYNLDIADFGISLLEIKYNSKFNHLTHAQIMGTLINRLGIERHVLGDILVQENRAQVFVEKSMVSYLSTQVSKIGRAAVVFEEIPFEKQLESWSDTKEVDVLASSMRLDKIISAVLKISRGTASKLIESEKVKLDYLVQPKVSHLVEVGSLISVRGYGRFTVKRDNGFSKHGKHKLTIDRIVHK
ncbi:YlmH family RNA-binding protein [Streptococcus orisasini]|uniref:YlmH family RNA-binding protein n=1 Tax=Streptococcus orisasini TaxID=1080071 RepID=UPI00070F6FC0|nr:YlmH/Sll1252 family protein [Streptococcus orisasini]